MDIIKRYKDLSLKNKELHQRARIYYSNLNTRLNIMNIIIVSAISISNNITAFTDNENKFLSIGYSILLYFSVVIGAIQQFLRYEELAEKHRTSSIRYNHLYNLCLISPESEVKVILEEYEDIYTSAPVIDSVQLSELPHELQKKDSQTMLQLQEQTEIDLATAYQLNRLLVQSYK